jgi:type IV secretion system protein VirB10
VPVRGGFVKRDDRRGRDFRLAMSRPGAGNARIGRAGAVAIASGLLEAGLAPVVGVLDHPAIVGLPGSTQQVTGQLQQQTQVQPTLRVRQGTSVSVFVAHDLDFSTVDD